MLATDGTWRGSDVASDNWRGAVDSALTASLVLLLFAGTFLLARRLGGALDTLLAPLPLVLTATGLLAWTAAIRLHLHDRRAVWLSFFVFALFALACSFPGVRTLDWLVWLSTLAAYGLIPTRCGSPAVGSDKVTSRLQQLTRSRMADGSETIAGTLLAEFAPGERTAVLHVAFCPPFERLPSVDAEVANRPACNVKVAQVLHQGVRLEARLSRASTAAQRVTIEFVASGRPYAV